MRDGVRSAPAFEAKSLLIPAIAQAAISKSPDPRKSDGGDVGMRVVRRLFVGF